MPGIQAVIFDLDDTLYPERAYCRSGFEAVARAFADQLGPPATAAARMYELLDTEHRSRIFNQLLEERGCAADEALLQRMIECYREHPPAIELEPAADQALSRLRDRYRLGLITDGPPAVQNAKINALALRSRLDVIIVTDELGGPSFRKPHPRAYELMVDRLGVDQPHCVYVGDNLSKDFLIPNRFGWRTIRLLRQDGIHFHKAALPDGEPQHVITTLDDLDALLV
jgi:putative hydrolase of the HAD superfamily